jgi:hypothetical protein
MNKLILFMCGLLMATAVSYVYAEEGQLTPFGASCPSCSTYGYCHKPLTNAQAIKNLNAYYEVKGLRVKAGRQFGRFLEADVYRDGKLVEQVILDRRTGRIRPIN